MDRREMFDIVLRQPVLSSTHSHTDRKRVNVFIAKQIDTLLAVHIVVIQPDNQILPICMHTQRTCSVHKQLTRDERTSCFGT